MSNSKRILIVAILLSIVFGILALRFGRLRGKAVKFIRSRVAAANSVTLSWDENAPGEDVIGYRIYEHIGDDYRLLGQVYFSTSYTVKNIRLSRCGYVVTAVNALGESARSSEVFYP